MECLGAWEGDDLVAYAAWTADRGFENTWVCTLVAVRVGFHNHGYGLRVKEQLVGLAAESEGIELVRSVVHRDNHAMLRINERLGCVLVSEGRRDEYLSCVIDVRERRPG